VFERIGDLARQSSGPTDVIRVPRLESLPTTLFARRINVIGHRAGVCRNRVTHALACGQRARG
jgi:hypothetical protein